jgi:recombination protein RecT
MEMPAEQQIKSPVHLVKRDTVDLVAAKVQEYMQRGELDLPPNYSPANALKSAWLILQTTIDRDKQPVLASCTKASIANALLDMVIQGLNPAKKQCYFIAYGNQLVCQRSYFGTMAVAKMVDPTIADIVAEVVYEGDEFIYKLERGKKIVVKHEQKLENIDPKKIKAAYAMIIDKNGEVRATEIMTFEQIKQAWRQSPIHPIDDKGNIKAGTTHEKFTAEMCMRTVINKVCKPIINSSDDQRLLQAVRRSEEVAAEVEAEEEIQANANVTVIDIEGTEAPAEPEQAEEPEAQEAPAESAEQKQPPARETQPAQAAKPPSQHSQQGLFQDGPGF